MKKPEGEKTPPVKTPEIWTVETCVEKAHLDFELEITRPAGCLEGGFTGKGTIKKTEEEQDVTAEGTFVDGDLVMVLSCEGMCTLSVKRSQQNFWLVTKIFAD